MQMGKRLFQLFLVLFFTQQAHAQLLEPVKWEMSSSQSGINEYILIFKATIDEGWKVYSKDVPEEGPLPTVLVFDELPPGVELVGEQEELGRMEEAVEPLFKNQVIKFYHKRLTLRQKVKISGNTTIKGYVDYMSCDDRQCSAFSKDFSFTLEGTSGATNTGIDYSQVADPVQWAISTEKISDTEYWIKYNALITPTWKLYSQNSPEGGAQPMKFVFENAGTTYHLSGKVEEIGHLETKAEPLFKNKVLKYYHDKAEMRQKIVIDSPNAVITGYIDYQTCDASQCLFKSKDFNLKISNGVVETIEQVIPESGAVVPKFGTFAVDTAYANNAVCAGDLTGQITDAGGKSLLGTFILGFIGGLIGLLMPCTFPMIPFTISFFTKHAGNRRKGIMNASFYGFSIVLVYFLASLPFLFFGVGGDKLNDFSTDNIVNLVFFFVFILFALSLFGLFEIKLPTKWANKADNASDVGGLMGIFFMALTLCIVSFSCTGPILGSLLANSLKDGGVALTMGMLGFGVAFALAFTLLALFPQLLNKMPKSGGWLNEVKIVFAFIEVAMAVKFLSNVDLAYHWDFLKREIFLGAWTIIALLIFLYISGVIRFPHDDKKVKWSTGRIVFALTFLATTVYFGQGLRKYGNVPMLSGFLPPQWYSIYEYDNECPLGLNCFHDLEEGIAFAKENNKPILIDFTGYACVNCRKMEEHVWPKDEIYSIINQEYVLVSLYVDDKEALALDEQYISATTGQKVRTIGNKWSDLQSSQFGTNAQPYYVLIAPDGKVLNQPRAYTPDVAEYKGFLECGLETFGNMDKVAMKRNAD
jgi:thiol:disulfide interchange protein